jgi:hypothetical protein
MSKGVTLHTSKQRSMFRRLLTAQRERDLWNRHLDSEDDSVSQRAFQLWLAYTYGKPLQPIEATGDGALIRIMVDHIGNTFALAAEAKPVVELMGQSETN